MRASAMRHRSLRRLGMAAALALAVHGPARGVDILERDPGLALDITESFLFDWHSTLDDAQLTPRPEHVVDFRNRLNLKLRIDPQLTTAGWRLAPLVIGGRLDIAWFPNPPARQYESDIRPEELYVRGAAQHPRYGRLSWTLGDDYASVGRGLALSLRKIDDLGFDVGLRGGHLQWQHPLVAVRLAAGVTNVVNVDGVEEKLVPDPNDLVFAARVEVRPTTWLRIGAHAVDVERRHSEVYRAFAPAIEGGADDRPLGSTRYLRSTAFGGNIEVPSVADVLSLYVEADGLRSITEQVGLRTRRAEAWGYAVYGAATLTLGPMTLLGEVKHYDHFELRSTPHPKTHDQAGLTTDFSYIVPPTLERYDQRVSQNSNVTGGHLRADLHIPETHDTVFLSGAYFIDAPIRRETTLHVYGGWEHRTEAGSRLQLQYGYRYEGAAGPGAIRLRMMHLDADLSVLLFGSHDLQVHWSHEFRAKDVGAPGEDEHVEGTAYASWNWSPHWSFSLQLEYLTSADSDETYYPGTFIQYRFTEDTFVRVFGGRMKGGLKCAGGVCRVFPDFEGIKVDATLRF